MVPAALLCILTALAADAPASRPLSELEMSRMEAVLLRRQIAQRDLDDATGKAQAIVADACKSVGAALDECDFDLQAKKVAKKPPAEKKPAEKK